MNLRTGSITLTPATLTHIRTELEAPEQLANLLGAYVSPNWPPGEYDRDAMEYFQERFIDAGKDAEGWYGWYALRDADSSTPCSLVGSAGYFGPPSTDGTVEIGYSVLPEWQRQGVATAMINALVENALSFTSIKRVIAHTTEDNSASVAALLRCGFIAVGLGNDPDTVRFEYKRNGA